MSPIVLYQSAKWTGSSMVDDWAKVFDHPRNIVLVESQEEEDYIWSMQLIYGGEVQIKHYTNGTPLRSYRMAARGNGRVFCTWDPNDPNRI